MTFKISVPGNFTEDNYGKLYYAVDYKHHKLAIVGSKAPDNVLKRYDFEFNDDTAKKYDIDYLPRESGDDD